MSRVKDALITLNVIGPHWNVIKCKNKLIDSKNRITSIVENDINIDKDRALNIFLGGYNDIDSVNTGYSLSSDTLNKAKKSLVIYPETFNKLSKSKQDKVATFLAKWRTNFNKLCANSANIICNSIESVSNKYGNKLREQVTSDIKRNLNDNNIIENISNGYVSIINEYTSNIKKAGINDKISWCLSSYSPLINSINSELNKNNDNRIRFQQLAAINSSYNIIPVINPSNYYTLTGGNNEKIIEKPFEKIVYKDRVIEKPTDRKESLYRRKRTANTIIEISIV